MNFERRTFRVAAEFLHEAREGDATRKGFYVFGSWRVFPSTPRRAFHHVEFASRVGRLMGIATTGQWEASANYYVLQNLRFMCDYIVHTEHPAGAPDRTLHMRANIRF